MILSRLTAAIRQQNWFAVALEFIIVIAGVVIGFQITAWNAARAETAREAAYLQQLDVELTTIVSTLERRGEEADAYFNWVTLFLEGAETGDPELAQEGSWGLNAITEVVRANIVPAVLTELISTGELRLVRDTELRNALASIPQMHNDSQSRMEQMAMRLSPVAFEISQRFEARLEGVADIENANYTTETLQFDFDAVAQDETFLRRLNYAALQNRFQASHLLSRRKELEIIRDQVRAEITERGFE
ncbi:hypothetical protein [Maricaulis sp.]|uniref:hypothetical protein n=1 Tax=Maricaulis sp. TaxID=1486257 RepID=UPI002B268EA3|nr:hypothetical protein [Maricaulis sp.]